MKSPRVLVCGYYGFGNSGDEAILSVLLGDLNRVFSSPHVVVVGGSIEAIAADHQVDAVSWTDIGRLRDEAAASDLMVMGGGGIFQDQQGFNPEAVLTPAHGGMSYWPGFALLSHLVDKPLAIYGVGVGPLTTDDGKRLTTISFRAADAASVRDEESARLLEELGVQDVAVTADPVFQMTADPAVGLEILDNEHIAGGGTTIAVGIRSWSNDSFLPQVAAELDSIIERHDAHIVFVPFQASPHRAENDAAASLRGLTQMQHRDRAAILRGTYTPEDKMAVLAASTAAIGMRLHAVIMAAAAGVPVVALAYDPKVVNTMKALGAAEMTIRLDETGLLAKKTGYALNDPSYGSRLLGGARRLAEAASRNQLVLTDALDRRRSSTDPVARETAALALRDLEVDLELQRVHALDSELEAVRTDRDRIQAEWDHLVGSRSLRLVNTWWSVRNRFKRKTAPALAAGSDLRGQLEDELSRVLETQEDAAGIVVYPPNIGWKAQLFQRPHQMARAFARMGYLTFFGVDWGGGEEVRGFRYEEDKLCLMGIPPEHLSILGAIPHPLMISYVYNFGFAQHLDEPTTVFEHIDHLDVFLSSYPIEQLESWFSSAVADADVVAASARDLQLEMLAKRPDTILCPNGVMFEHFAGYRPGPPPDDLSAAIKHGPIVGYYGALAEWIDYDLLDHAAQNLPEYAFVFIGPNYDLTMDRQKVFDRPNVWWLGPKPYEQLPAYLHHFTVATIPFLVNEVTHRVSPLKLFEYMAGGKPIVTTAMREAQHYDLVMVADDPDEWVKRLVDAVGLAGDAGYVAGLYRMARANTWEQRVGTLIDAATKKA